MMMGLPVKGHSLRRVHQLPVAKGTEAPTIAAAPTWRRTLPAPRGRPGGQGTSARPLVKTPTPVSTSDQRKSPSELSSR